MKLSDFLYGMALAAATFALWLALVLWLAKWL
jgi:hypothetical protein